MHILDVQDDLGASLVAGLEGTPPPDLLKTAEWREPYEALDRDFALILVDDHGEHRKYACHDAGNTAVSMFYLRHAVPHHSPTAVKVAAANLARIGQHQGLEIPADIQKLASGVFEEDDVIDERRVHYRAPAQKVASTKLAGFDLLHAVQQQWSDLQPHEKRASALRLRREAETIPLAIPDEIYAYSGDALNPKFAMHMAHRARERGEPEYTRLAKVAGVLGVDETLQVLFALDAATGLRFAGDGGYGSSFADPYLAVFGTEKTAMWSWSHGGDNVNQAQLMAFASRPESANVFKLTFSDGLWLRFTQEPLGTFKGLPLEQQVLVSRMARQVQ